MFIPMMVTSSAASSGYIGPFSQSLIFDGSSDTSGTKYMSRTGAGASTSTKIGTISTFVRFSGFNATSTFKAAICYIGNTTINGNNLWLERYGDKLRVRLTNSEVNDIITTRSVFRDTGHYHILVHFDSTEASSANRLKILVNGVELDVAANYPAFDFAIENGSGDVFDVGSVSDGTQDILNATTMCDFHWVDGTIIPATTFLKNQTFNGSTYKAPKAVAGIAYGDNGFHLDFANSSNYGLDVSGNGNNLTDSGSLATADQSSDLPADPTANWNAAIPVLSNLIINQGGTKANFSSAAGTGMVYSTIPVNDGKFHFEVNVSGTAGSSGGLGVGIASIPDPTGAVASTELGQLIYDSTTGQIHDGTDGSVSTVSYGDAWTSGDRITCEVDFGAGNTIQFFKNGSGQGAYSPDGTLLGTYFVIAAVDDVSTAHTIEYELITNEADFTDALTLDYKAWRGSQINTPTAHGKDHFAAEPRTGTSSVFSVTGLPFKPGMVWIKNREAAIDHNISDVPHGDDFQLRLNLPNPELTSTTSVTGYNADGYDGGSSSNINGNGFEYIDYLFNVADSTSSNSDGTITSNVAVNSEGFMSVLSYTSTGVNATVGHGLTKAPELLFTKRVLGSDSYITYSKSVTLGDVIRMDDNTIPATSSSYQSIAPTASVFSIGTNADTNSGTAQPYNTYCFTSVDGLCLVGDYLANGDADGTYIYCGFKPKLVMLRNLSTSAGKNWSMYDTGRVTANVMDSRLFADLASAETSDSTGIDITSDGFKIRVGSSSSIGQTGNPILFIAFAETAGGGDLPYPLAF